MCVPKFWRRGGGNSAEELFWCASKYIEWCKRKLQRRRGKSRRPVAPSAGHALLIVVKYGGRRLVV